jgi:hypothetical protein
MSAHEKDPIVEFEEVLQVSSEPPVVEEVEAEAVAVADEVAPEKKAPKKRLRIYAIQPSKDKEVRNKARVVLFGQLVQQPRISSSSSSKRKRKAAAKVVAEN